jgi:glutamine synthetase
MKPADVIKLIKDKEVKYADLRFTDTRGKEQHVTIPANLVDEDLFRDGKMFDGSSIAGWKGINESDMILALDPTTAVSVRSSSRPRSTSGPDYRAGHQGYGDPRLLGKRAEAYLKSTGIALMALKSNSSSLTACAGTDINDLIRHRLVRDSGTATRYFPRATRTRPGLAGYFPVPPVDAFQDIRSAMWMRSKRWASTSKCTHEVATGGQ